MAFDEDAFLTALDSMTVMELNDLVKAIEEKFGVSAAAMSAPAAGGGAAAAVVEENTEFKVVLLEAVFFFQAEDGIRDLIVTGVQTCALQILTLRRAIPLDEDTAPLPILLPASSREA